MVFPSKGREGKTCVETGSRNSFYGVPVQRKSTVALQLQNMLVGVLGEVASGVEGTQAEWPSDVGRIVKI
ncbi:hypothetical protein OIDMADRAFT_59593 [Oidiodendron maius Zn]|uniref:Uncharacterized protein n=1 Tax=Oidiodendron maius (strain Zn) TaxID=913774 RepID=A0A0C3GZY6_OIDMZ|nr:hypothetical protein OIDMADRAFT_59593 [Oidiodendron maius Zn]